MQYPEPFLVAPLLPKLDEKLLSVLRACSPTDWGKRTLASAWTVKDIAAHLLDGNLRSLSMLRDNYFGESPDSSENLLPFLNRLNADWVKAMKRLSPGLLIELLEVTGRAYTEYIGSLDPFEKAVFSVAWAGEEESKNWFHIAREYTEKWHHQQQIRVAVGAEAELLQEQWYYPYLRTSVRALPFHYRKVTAAEGTLILFVFVGASDKCWYLKRQGEHWQLLLEADAPADCTVRIQDNIAWRIFTKGIDRELAKAQSQIEGDPSFGEPIFQLTAVMA